MGNRAHARFDFPAQGDVVPHIYIYTHWQGPEGLMSALTEAVQTPAAQARVGDDEYFTRIVVQRALIELGADPYAETGYGLGVTEPDGPLVAVLDVSTGKLTAP